MNFDFILYLLLIPVLYDTENVEESILFIRKLVFRLILPRFLHRTSLNSSGN